MESDRERMAAMALHDDNWRRKDLRQVQEALGCGPLLATAEKAARVLAKANMAHLFIGGLAVQHHGYVRNTLDVDIVVADVDAACAVLAAHGFREHPGPGGFRWSNVKVIMTDEANGVDVDLMPAGVKVGKGGLPLPTPKESRPVPQYEDVAALVSLKLSSALAEPDLRSKDKSDVVELIKAGLPQDLLVDESVKAEYARLWKTVQVR